MTKVKTRFAPSPTGDLHIGSLRTAVYAYALARHYKGEFVLRIEDTDKKREVEGSREKIEEQLKLFGLEWDEHYVQSERKSKGIYKKAAEKLVASGHAYYCQCKPKNAKVEGYSKQLRDPCRDLVHDSGAIKLKVPDGEGIGFKDYVLQKKISWSTSDVADATLLKSDGFPTYHLAVVVDDNDMGITHALRGHDWMPSTPIHLLVYKYLGLKQIEIGHLTDILDPEGGKLSKRKGSVSIDEMMGEGYLPEALLNFVILLGWAPKDNREIFTLAEFVQVFNENGFQRSNPVFNRDKLDWMNGEYIKKSNDSDLAAMIYDYYEGKYDKEMLLKTVPLVKERMNKLSEYELLADFFYQTPKIEKQHFRKLKLEHLSMASGGLNNIESWTKENIDKILMKIVEEEGYNTGDFFMNIRVAITGKKVTPPINDSIAIMDQKEVISRLYAQMN